MKYRVGDKVRIKSIYWYNLNKGPLTKSVELINGPSFVKKMSCFCHKIMTIVAIKENVYRMEEDDSIFDWTDEMIEGLAEKEKRDMGEVSDGYHTFNELYEYRLLYNASMFNELAKQGLYDVHKSKRHSDGEIPFGDSNWFIVMAELPTGQISNHYEMKDWDLFQIPEKEKANVWDGHTPKDVAERIRVFLNPKPKYPTTYEECCKVLNLTPCYNVAYDYYRGEELDALYHLLICRDAYWKIAGWKPDYTSLEYKYYINTYRGKIDEKDYTMHCNHILTFPIPEMRDAFYENFKDLINDCKELL